MLTGIEKVGHMIKVCFIPFCAMAIGLCIAAWMSSFIPQESSFQITYNQDGTATADYVMTHHDGKVEKCVSFYQVKKANSFGVYLRPVSTSCIPANKSENTATQPTPAGLAEQKLQGVAHASSDR